MLKREEREDREKGEERKGREKKKCCDSRAESKGGFAVPIDGVEYGSIIDWK